MTPSEEAAPDSNPPPEGSGEPKTPAASFWPPSAAVLHPLPPIAAKHDDLEAIKKAVEDAASVSGPLWLSYLFALFYIALAAAAVNHVDLLLENPVKLPFLNIELALKAFFVLVPLLFVVLHAYTLAHFVLLSDKAKRFHQELQRQIGVWAENGAEIRKDLRRQLPSNIFVQFLAGPEDLREGAFGWLLNVIAWVTLFGGPVLVLLLLQLQFLPFHSSAITWVARGALLVDLVLIGWLMGLILSGRSSERAWWGLKPRVAKAMGVLISCCALVLSWFVFTFPGEWEELPYNAFPVAWLEAPRMAATDWFFGRPRENLEAHVRRWPANTLQLPDFDIYEALKLEPDKVKWRTRIFDFQDRHLEYADLARSKLENVDFQFAYLKGASLSFAQLQGVTLIYAQLQGASLDFAQLLGAKLDFAQAQGASFKGCLLTGASLRGAHLQGAALDLTDLQGASLHEAQLQGASFGEARLQGAMLDRAQLQGASLKSALLWGASLFGAYLWRADLGELAPWGVRQIKTEGIDWSAAWVRQNGSVSERYKWDDRSYGELLMMLGEIPEGDRREAALARADRLDCNKSEASLASCDPEAKWPVLIDEWRRMLDGGHTSDQAANRRELAGIFSQLVCSGGPNAIYVLRGLARDNRFEETGGDQVKLMEEFLDDRNQCPVSAALTAEDRAQLLEIKKRTEEATKAEAMPTPPPAPEKQPESQPQPPAPSKRANSSRTRSAP